jgi:hypothetical protein
MRKLMAVALLAFSPVALGQDAGEPIVPSPLQSVPPKPDEVAKAVKEQQDAAATVAKLEQELTAAQKRLDDARKSLEASQQRMEAVLRRLLPTAPPPEAAIPVAFAQTGTIGIGTPAPASSTIRNVLPGLPIVRPESVPAVASASRFPAERDATVDALKAILDRLERIERRLAELDKADKK